jgi:hypothetical protein
MTLDLLRGHCCCGTVRIELAPPTLFASYCHCETCRRVHGAPFVAWTAVPRDAFRVTDGGDNLHEYTSSPGVIRAFCSRCGSPISYRADTALDRIYVPVAILDTIDRALESHVSYEERVPWLSGVHTLPCFIAKSETPIEWR